MLSKLFKWSIIKLVRQDSCFRHILVDLLIVYVTDGIWKIYIERAFGKNLKYVFRKGVMGYRHYIGIQTQNYYTELFIVKIIHTHSDCNGNLFHILQHMMGPFVSF